MIKKLRKTAKIFKIDINSTSKTEVISFVESSLKSKHKFFITTPNPEILLEARENTKLRDAINMSDVAVSDGVGLKLFASVNVVKGREVMFELFRLANERGLKIFLLGSSGKVIKNSLERLKVEYPNVIVKGESGPKLDKSAKSISHRNRLLYKKVVRDVNVFQPDILFVAFGAPKQEIWVMDNFGNLNVGGVMVVGGSLDYFSGWKRLPPRIFELLYIEWLWRLLTEFGRPDHVKRIFRAVVVFPFFAFLDKFERK